MTKYKKKAFSLVELMVTITILAILGAILVSINSGYRDKTANTKVSTDLGTIENTFRTYKQEIGSLPNPSGNLKYFTDTGDYAHDETESFGVHGFITEKTIPKRFISFLPIDPKTGNYYAYGKTFKGGAFEIGGVLTVDSTHETIVKGNYTSETGLYNIIREYNGPEFIYDKSKTRFPYNPVEFIMTAKISSYSGSITINDNITNGEEILNKILISGDKITLAAGSYASIYFSDGSITDVGDSNSPTELTLANMKYKKENNLYTKINLALNFGSVIVKASKMSEDSEFNMYTSDTEASVRGTIFGVYKLLGSTGTTVNVIKGEVDIIQIENTNIDNLIKNLKVEKIINKKEIKAETINNESNTDSVLSLKGGIINLVDGQEVTVTNTNIINSTLSTDVINDLIEDEAASFQNEAASSTQTDTSESGTQNNLQDDQNSNQSDSSYNESEPDNNETSYKKKKEFNGRGCEKCPNGYFENTYLNFKFCKEIFIEKKNHNKVYKNKILCELDGKNKNWYGYKYGN